MAKSHVEKLKAIKEVEDKKNSEIVVSYLSWTHIICCCCLLFQTKLICSVMS
jgi:hypothetical protein